MELANESLTIYNHYSMGREGDRWTRTVMHGVSWYKSTQSAITSTGYGVEEVHLIRIPVGVAIDECKQYIESCAFKDADKGLYWTIQGGDKAVRGISDIPPDDEDLDTKLEKGFQDAVNIRAWADNRRGIPQGQHWRIEAT